MSTAAQLLKIAAKEVGVREGRDTGGNWNNRVKYNDWYAKHPSIRNNGFLTTAWCSTFVSWVANQAGLLGSVIPMHAWTPSGLAWFKSRGLWTQGKGVKPGDLFYVYYPAQRESHMSASLSASRAATSTPSRATRTTPALDRATASTD